MGQLSTHWVRDDYQLISIRQWQGGSYPKGVIHIVHGMMEHSGMYHDWAKALCELGWDVVSHDHPGSGYTVIPECGPDHLPLNGMPILIKTARFVDDWIKERYPQQPVVRYGHSMGAFLSLVLEKNNVKADGVILTGCTHEPSWAVHVQARLIRALGSLFGVKKPAKLAHAMSIKPLNRAFKPTKTNHDWVSRMPDVLSQYSKDPLCGNTASWGYYHVVNDCLKEMNGPIELPDTLMLTGERDPLSKGGKKLRPLINKLRPMAKSIEHVVVSGAHHKVECDEETPLIIMHIKRLLDTI